MRIRKVCREKLYAIPFDVYATDHTDGSFDCETRRMEIGIQASWNMVLDTLLHETVECALALLNARFVNPSMRQTSDNMMFCFDHNTFSMATCVAASFIARVEPELKQLHKKYHHAS